ncbi:uncharacterized protein LOC124469310 isoform X3 [Hypomesus transpacificus]|uniref:uncharacterized protein LOC124469310 isoform X3 n=1 Tax=Hypomesus transpacificus TaxID=137520 RepID=UPI001F07B58E|nr:uncharacterized protein LOC124469310 isoform X3 [Hypomesus transpacificus]
MKETPPLMACCRRNRFMMRNDLKKQREYFEKKKMQRKTKIPLPSSPKDTGSGSVDLVTLFIVNQIAAKKENCELPKITHLNDNRGCVGLIKGEPLELPMSPCSSSRLSLVESQPQYSFNGIRKRKHCFPEGFKCQQLSPVLESNLSDNSASDYQLAHIADTLSPFSSSSSASSSGLFPLQLKGQTQLFPLQLRGQTQPQRSPRPWGATSKKAQVLSSSHGECRCSVYLDVTLCSALQFRPYSHPSGMRESPPGGAVPAGPPRYHQTPSLSTVLFGSTGSTETRNKDIHTLGFSLKQPDSEELLTEEELFRGFSNEFRSDAYFGKGNSKISLKADSQNSSSKPPDVKQPHSIHPIPDSLTQLSDCADVTSSCLEQNHASVDCGGSSPSYSPRGGYFSSESDDENDCHQCVQERPHSLPAQLRPDGTLGASEASPWSPPPAPCERSPGSRSSYDLGAGTSPGLSERLCNCASSNCSLTDRGGRYRAQSLITARHKIVATQTRDMGTQTVLPETCQTTEASTQCSFAPERNTNNHCQCCTLGNDSKQLCVAAGGVVPTQVHRGQASPRDGGLRHGARPDWIRVRREEQEHTPWRRVTTGEDRTGHLSINSVHKPLHLLTESRVSMQSPATPILGDVLSTNVTESDKQMDQRVDRVKGEVLDPVGREGEALITNLAEKQQKVTSEDGVTRLSEEDQTLHEISDVLLMLKERKKSEGSA